MAYRTGDYATTRRLLTPLAEAGNSQAQYVVGYMIFYGQGVAADEKAARTWFQRSARQGFPKAEIALSRILMAEKMKTPRGAGIGGSASQSGPAQGGTNQPVPAPSPLGHPPGSGASLPSDATTISPRSGKSGPDPVKPPPSNTHRPLGTAKDATRQAPAPSNRLSITPAARPSQRAVASDNHIRNEAWIESREARHYTIQLAAIADNGPKEAIAYIKRHALAQRAAYFRFRRGRRDWYGVIYGAYPTLSSARAALNRLPKPLRQHEPWIQTFAHVQERISANGGNT